MLSDPGDALTICPNIDVKDFAFWFNDTIGHPSNRINGAQSLQPKAYGLQPPCLRLTHGVTDVSSRLGTGCVGSTLSWRLFQPPAK